MNQSKPIFKKGDYINAFVGIQRTPTKLYIINIFDDRFYGRCYVVLSGNHPLTIPERDLIDVFQAIAIPPDERF